MILRVIGVLADVFGVLSMWLDLYQLPTWSKWVITGVGVVLAVFLLLIEISTYDAKVKNYINENNTITELFINKTRYLRVDSLVSIYKTALGVDTLVAIGYLITTNKESEFQVKIIRIVDAVQLNEMSHTRNSYKNFVVRPNVRFFDTPFAEEA